ncbi:tungstate ABC transporter substrate-binding protein WtpA [Methanospirillum stamsii]|uniref:Tungstate ABC transporter substrate-binding protein WtpA n=1 Tax=Methanospirillum stamsii TaxID=1277351 RepID=A0A2V2NDD2_9EURY|nr:tungstate ABC transporter substrate-binding protein WtpA [Methanospirillum stamsii]PWR73601.1 tungstate ABC transporter substrate-binding protein WtpA [Methanospirillum stamsii]
MGFKAGVTSLGSILCICLIIFLFFSGCTDEREEKTQVRVLAAGSLLLPFEQIEKRFEEKYPETDVLVEGHGSIQCIRQVTDLNRQFDIVAVADDSLIPILMYRPMPKSEKNWTDSHELFGRTEMVLAYTNKSAYAGEISTENWYEILMKPDVRFGCANPVLDASGYRAIMVLALADRFYNRTDILDTIYTGQFSPGIPVRMDELVTQILLPDVMKPSSRKVTIRDGSIFLLSLLQTGGIDYALEYRCVAEGENLKYISLPDAINLGNTSYADNYKSAVVDLNFKRFSTIDLTRIGAPIVYAVCIPALAEHPEEARVFIAELTGDNSDVLGMPYPI